MPARGPCAATGGHASNRVKDPSYTVHEDPARMALCTPETGDGLLSRWLDHLQNLDFTSLLGLYHPEVRFEGFSEILVGREELAEVLEVHGRRLRGVRIASVRAQPDEQRLLFDTTLLGRFGAARLRHEWALDDGLIRQHRVAFVDA